MNKLFSYTKGDTVIWLVVVLLSILSLLTVYSSTGSLAYKMQGGNTLHYLVKHAGLLTFGMVLMYGAHLLPYTVYSRLSVIAIFIAIPLLLFTLLMGANLNAASRWIMIPGTSITFQTSDLGKLALIMYVARLLSKKQEEIKDFKSAFVPIMLPILVVCGLILPANFSTSAVLFATCLVLMFIGRINMKYIILLVISGLVCLTLFIAASHFLKLGGRVGTWQKRIENFSGGNVDSDANYQSTQAKIAIAKGGIFGRGPGNSTQRNFLPESYSDFIYAIICEEYGFIGAGLVVLLYLTLFLRAVRIVIKSPRAFASLLAIGCSFSLVFQAMINLAVAVNIFPVTGQPLPLLSMGGTSLWFTSVSIGIVLSVSRDVEQNTSLEGGEFAKT